MSAAGSDSCSRWNVVNAGGRCPGLLVLRVGRSTPQQGPSRRAPWPQIGSRASSGGSIEASLVTNLSAGTSARCSTRNSASRSPSDCGRRCGTRSSLRGTADQHQRGSTCPNPASISITDGTPPTASGCRRSRTRRTAIFGVVSGYAKGRAAVRRWAAMKRRTGPRGPSVGSSARPGLRGRSAGPSFHRALAEPGRVGAHPPSATTLSKQMDRRSCPGGRGLLERWSCGRRTPSEAPRSPRAGSASIDLRRVDLVLYRTLADLVVIAQLMFIVFVAAGSLLVSEWPRLLWPHLAVVAWAAAIVTVGFTCPLTPLEKHFREQAGHSSYDGGFVDHYLDGVIYPGRFTAVARLLVGILIVVGYALLLIGTTSPARRRRRRDRRPSRVMGRFRRRVACRRSRMGRSRSQGTICSHLPSWCSVRGPPALPASRQPRCDPLSRRARARGTGADPSLGRCPLAAPVTLAGDS